MSDKNKRNAVIAGGLAIILLYLLWRSRGSGLQSTDPMSTNYGPDASGATSPEVTDAGFSPAQFLPSTSIQNYPAGSIDIGGDTIGAAPSYMTYNIPNDRNETQPVPASNITLGGSTFGSPSGCSGCGKSACTPSCECGGPQNTLVSSIDKFISGNSDALNANADNVASAMPSSGIVTTQPVIGKAAMQNAATGFSMQSSGGADAPTTSAPFASSLSSVMGLPDSLKKFINWSAYGTTAA